MKKTILFVALIGSVLTVACSKSDVQEPNIPDNKEESKKVEITASLPSFSTPDTKTIISAGTGDNNASYHVYWYYGETLNVIRKSDYKICPFTNKVTTDPGTSGIQEATFVNDNVGDFFDTENETFVALFGVKLITDSTGKAIGFEMPSEISQGVTDKGNYMIDHAPMFGLTPAGGDNKSFQFHNACAILSIYLKGDTFDKAVVSTTSEVALSGTIDINNSLASATANPDKYIVLAAGGSKSVTVTPPYAVNKVFIPLPQCTVGNLTINLYKNGNKILSKTNSTENKLEHGKIYEVSFSPQ